MLHLHASFSTNKFSLELFENDYMNFRNFYRILKHTDQALISAFAGYTGAMNMIS